MAFLTNMTLMDAMPLMDALALMDAMALMDVMALMNAMASEATKDLVSQLLVVDPRSRMSAEDVLHRVQRCQGHCDPL